MTKKSRQVSIISNRSRIILLTQKNLKKNHSQMNILMNHRLVKIDSTRRSLKYSQKKWNNQKRIISPKASRISLPKLTSHTIKLKD